MGMKKGKKRMGMTRRPAMSLKMKTTQRVAVAAGITVILMSCGIFMYMNFGDVKDTKAAVVDRLCISANPVNEFSVKSVIVLPPEQQPARANQPNLINQRKAKVLPPQN